MRDTLRAQKKARDDKRRLEAMLDQARKNQAATSTSGDVEAAESGALVVQSLEAQLAQAESVIAAGQRESQENARHIIHGGPDRQSSATLGRGQSLADVVTLSADDVSLPGLIRGLALGDWKGTRPDVVALLTSGVPAAVPGYVSAGIVDIAREQSIVFRAGARLLPIDVPSAKVARMTSEPAIQWEPESAERDLADGAWSFDAAELTASSAWLYTTLSIEAVEDAVDLDGVVQNAFAAQLALAFDQAALAGTGADQPVGIALMDAATDRILEANAVGPIVDYRPFVRAVGAVKAAHHEPSSVILTPDLWTELNCLQDADYNPLGVPRAYAALDEYVSSFLPSDGGVGTNEHTAVVADLTKLTIGVRTDVTIEVSRLGAGFKKGAVEVRGYVRFGTFLTDPTALCVMRGLTLPGDESPGS